jgi:DNA-binding MarR family transcriptional regulator
MDAAPEIPGTHTMTPFSENLRLLIRERLGDYNVRQIAILLEIGAGNRTVKGISEALGCPRPAVTRAMDQFVADGLAIRSKCAKDRRVVHMDPTEKGLRIWAWLL